jgi:hypothetical protein
MGYALFVREILNEMKHLFVKWRTLGDALLDALLDVVRRTGIAAFRPRASSVRVLSLGDVPFILFSLLGVSKKKNKLDSGEKGVHYRTYCVKGVRYAHIAHCTKCAMCARDLSHTYFAICARGVMYVARARESESARTRIEESKGDEAP